MSRPELRATLRAEQRTAYLVARHYATKLRWPVTPAYHDQAGRCGKHPSVPWNTAAVDAGRIAGPARNEEQVRRYFLDDARGLADICVHVAGAGGVVLDCDRSDKGGVFVDGLANLIAFAGDEIESTLCSLTKRGVHLWFACDFEIGSKIKTQAGALLPGVDVRGGHASGGISIEPNGVCAGRRWGRGVPRIGEDGSIVGIEDLGPIEFDADGNCISGLPMPDSDGWPVGIAPLPPLLLDALLFTSGARDEHEVDPRVVAAWRSRLRGRPSPRRTAEGAGRTSSTSISSRPYALASECSCGTCERFDEAKKLLSWIPAEIGHDAWRDTIFAVSAMLNGKSCGAELVAEWSAASCNPTRRDPAGARSIYSSDRRHRHGC